LNAELQLHRDAGGLEALVDVANLTGMFQRESHVEIRWIGRRWRVEQVAHRKLESGVAVKDRDLSLPLVAAAQVEETPKEFMSCVDIRDLKVEVIESHGKALVVTDP